MPLVGELANSTLSGRLKFLRALPKGGALKIYKKILSKNIFIPNFVELSMIGDKFSEELVKVEIVKFSRIKKFTILP